MPSAQRRQRREQDRYYRSYYMSIQGPEPGQDQTLVRPRNALEITKGMPLEPHQKERVAGAAANLSGPDRQAMRRVCRDIGIRDQETVIEICRRQAALAGLQKSIPEKGHREPERWEDIYQPEGKHIDKVAPGRRDHSKPEDRYAQADPDVSDSGKRLDFYMNRQGVGTKMDWKQSRLEKSLSMDTAGEASETLGALEKALAQNAVSLAMRAELHNVIRAGRAWGIDVATDYPLLVKAATGPSAAPEPALEVVESVPREDDGFMDIFVKSEKPAGASFRLGRKLLRPYVQCLTHRCVIKAMREHVAEQHDIAKAAGYRGDHPPFIPLEPAEHAEYVWADLVKKAAKGDQNLADGLDVVGRPWVLETASAMFREHLGKLNPGMVPDQFATPQY